MAKSIRKFLEIRPYLKSVRLRDYRSIHDAKASFKLGVNIIIGENGSGKTNFLSLVSELANLDATNSFGAGCEMTFVGEVEINAVFKQRPTPIRANRRAAQRVSIAPSPLIVEVFSEDQRIEASTLREAFAKADKWPGDYEVIPVWYGIPKHLLPVIDNSVDFTLNKSGMTYSYGASIIKDNSSRFVSSLFYAIGEVIHFLYPDEEWTSDAPITLDAATSMIVKAVKAHLIFLNEALPIYSGIQAVRQSNTLQIYQNTVQDEVIIKGLVFEYKVNGEWLPFSALSDGTKRIFYIIAEVVPPTWIMLGTDGLEYESIDFRKIIFLEEPELGIHPEQLHKLLSLIREVSREHQVIMTTHSPQVLDMLTEKELDRITICELDPKKGTQFRKLSKAKQEEARTYMREKLHLSDYWRYSFLEEKD